MKIFLKKLSQTWKGYFQIYQYKDFSRLIKEA